MSRDTIGVYTTQGPRPLARNLGDTKTRTFFGNLSALFSRTQIGRVFMHDGIL